MHNLHSLNNKKRGFTRTPKSLSINLRSQRGFTLLFSVLVSSLLLAIGLAVFNIGQKELILSSTARESQFAFYAADTGIECALYWDFKHGTFSPAPFPSDITCSEITVTGVGGKDYGTEATFRLKFSPEPDSYCVDVTVLKTDSPRRTYVEARGYNTCVETNPRRVERAIRVKY